MITAWAWQILAKEVQSSNWNGSIGTTSSFMWSVVMPSVLLCYDTDWGQQHTPAFKDDTQAACFGGFQPHCCSLCCSGVFAIHCSQWHQCGASQVCAAAATLHLAFLIHSALKPVTVQATSTGCRCLRASGLVVHHSSLEAVLAQCTSASAATELDAAVVRKSCLLHCAGSPTSQPDL